MLDFARRCFGIGSRITFLSGLSSCAFMFLLSLFYRTDPGRVGLHDGGSATFILVKQVGALFVGAVIAVVLQQYLAGATTRLPRPGPSPVPGLSQARRRRSRSSP